MCQKKKNNIAKLILISPFSFSQEQYIFVYKAVLEALTCGNTEISAQDMRLSLKKLAAVDPHEGKTGFEEEFDVSNFV